MLIYLSHIYGNKKYNTSLINKKTILQGYFALYYYVKTGVTDKKSNINTYIIRSVPWLIEERVAVPVRRQHALVEVLQRRLHSRPLYWRGAFAELARFLLWYCVAGIKWFIVKL